MTVADDQGALLSLFAAVAETEESARNTAFQKFKNQGAEYYGDVDEMDQDLVKEEEELEREGKLRSSPGRLGRH